jgi:cell volume regulation protein A|nr:potassium/proton antiporter [Paramuribaculum intestinale]
MEQVSTENLLLAGSTLLVAGVLAGKSSHRVGLPLLLIFLLTGMAFGTDGLGMQFSDIHTAQSIGMVALCVILFSGGMGTKISSIRPVVAPGLVLSTVGVLLTALFTGLFIWWLSGMSWTNIHFPLVVSLLLAATMSSTDSASVFGILGAHKTGLRHHLRPMLELESGSNDPMAYMLTIVLIEAATTDASLSVGHVVGELLMQFGVGIAGGFLTGRLTVWLASVYRRLGGAASDSEDPAQAVAMTAILIVGCVFFSFAATTALGGNGYLAVYLCGITVGNGRVVGHRGIAKFIDGITWLAQIVVFLMLGLLVNPHEMLSVAAVSLLIGVFMIVVGRPLSVFCSLMPFRSVGRRSKLFVSWVGLRGAVPIIFATYPVVAHVEGASQIFNIVFFVTILSLLVQGTTVMVAARRLDLVGRQEVSDDHFGVEIPDELPTSLHTLTLTETHLANSDLLCDLELPQGSLVIMIRRGGRYIVPNGRRRLQPSDVLLIIRED